MCTVVALATGGTVATVVSERCAELARSHSLGRASVDYACVAHPHVTPLQIDPASWREASSAVGAAGWRENLVVELARYELQVVRRVVLALLGRRLPKSKQFGENSFAVPGS